MASSAGGLNEIQFPTTNDDYTKIETVTSLFGDVTFSFKGVPFYISW
jgi:hypothetical protein